MNARILTTATLAIAFTAILPAKAADPQLVNLLMPDAQVVAGVNVDQAKATPFGQYVLSQVQTNNSDLQELISLTGFDPTRDVREVLVASSNTTGRSGLFLARGNFDAKRIAAAATGKGAVTEEYGGVTILEDPKKTNGIAFLDSTLVVAGDLANVKAAIDRQNKKTISSIPSALAVQLNDWSTTQDAWAISAVPLSTLHPSPNAPPVPGLNGQGAFQAIQQAAGGVKFGNLIVVKAKATADTAQNAQSMADALKLLLNLAQMHAANDPTAAALVQSVQITASGNILNIAASLPSDQFQQLVSAPHRPRQAPSKRAR